MTVLIAYAHTPEGQAALDQGRALAAKDGLAVLVFDLSATSDEPDRSIAPPEEDGAPDLWFAPARHSRSAPDELIDLADSRGATLIVVGVRRRSPLGKFVLGSHAQHIIIAAHTPVLTVKVPGHER